MPTIVVHGGAGGGGEPQLDGVRVALEAGRAVLSRGGTAVDAAVAAVVALEADGRGEAFMRAVFAYRVAASTEPLDVACAAALDEVKQLGGLGGCIAITADGTAALHHNTQVMPAGWATTDGALHVQLAG